MINQCYRFVLWYLPITAILLGAGALSAQEKQLSWEELVEENKQPDKESASNKDKDSKEQKTAKSEDHAESTEQDEDEFEDDEHEDDSDGAIGSAEDDDNDQSDLETHINRFRVALTFSSELQRDFDSQSGSSMGVVKNFSLAPDLWYYPNEKISLGWVHSYRGALGVWNGLAQTLCFGDDYACDKLFVFTGFRGIYKFLETSGFSLAADGTLMLAADEKTNGIQTERNYAAIFRSGVEIKYRYKKLDLTFNPALTIRVPNESQGTGQFVDTNKLLIPASLTYSIGATRVGLQYVLEKYLEFLFGTEGTTNDLSFIVEQELGKGFQAALIWGAINFGCAWECSGLNVSASKSF